MTDANQAINATVLNVAKHLEDRLDEEINKLDNLTDKDITEIRRKRIEEIKNLAEQKKKWVTLQHGEYIELEEKEFFKEVKKSERVICHFYRDNWPCKVMDKHMDILSKSHIETRFIKIHAEKSPFLTERLKIWMLPTLALIKNGKVEDYVVGFEELGQSDDFTTQTLELRLKKSEMLFNETTPVVKNINEENKSIRKSTAYKKSASDEDSDFDN